MKRKNNKGREKESRKWEKKGRGVKGGREVDDRKDSPGLRMS